MKASDYKKLASKKQITEQINLPSGATVTWRNPPIQQWVLAGKLPASLVGKMAIAAQSKDPEKMQAVLTHLTEDEFASQITLGRELLTYAMVEPKVAAEPTDGYLTFQDILPEDFEFLMRLAWSGGKQGESLETFRP